MKYPALSIALIVLISAGTAHARLAANGLRTNGTLPESVATKSVDAQTSADTPSLKELASQALAR